MSLHGSTPAPQVGDSIHLIRPEDEATFETVLEQLRPGGVLMLRAREACSLRGEDVRLDYVDGQVSWSADAERMDDDGELVEVRLLGAWYRNDSRAAVRVEVDREILEGEMMSGTLPERTPVHLVCVDVSATGCRAIGSGRQIARDDVLRVRPRGEDDSWWIYVRCVRVDQLAFGRWSAAFQFQPIAAAERTRTLAWRDTWAAFADAKKAAASAPEQAA